ncbi:MAG: transglutaminase domain-containing protein [bacterium]|nr:transglutaminase domain-containing protein [bacterium]
MQSWIRKLKPIVYVVLVCFTYTCVGGNNFVYAATKGRSQKPEVRSQKKEKTTAEKWARTIEELKAKGEELKVGELKDKEKELKELDRELRKEFKETEKFLKAKKLPSKILQRHDDFVKQYEKNFAKLQGKLNAAISANSTEREAKSKELKEFIEKAQYQPKPRPLDPNKLPHRMAPKLKPREPRIKVDSSQKSVVSSQRTEDRGQNERLKPELQSAVRNPQSKIENPKSSNSLYASAGLPDTFVLAQSTGEQSPTSNLPAEADLAETIDVQITPEIRRLATNTLKGNPVLIYEYVRNNFDYEPYYGSLKGSQQTLWEKAGNDFDLASLLIALYRAANIPARYVYGTIEIPIEKAMNWVGVKDKKTACDIFATAGIPVAGITSGGEITKVRLEHCWVEVYIAYLPYFGAKDWNKGRKCWVSIDPSFKQYEYPEDTIYTDPDTNETIEIKNIDISKRLPFDTDEYLSGTQTLPPFMEYLEDINDWLVENTPAGVVYNIFAARSIIPELPEVLPGLPNKILSINERYSEIPDNLRHKVRFGGNINYEVSTPQIAFKRITLSYTPATSEDQSIINEYGTLYDVPAYLINLKPQLKIDGEVKTTGDSIGMGEEEIFSMEFIEPSGYVERVANDVTAGAYYGIGIGVGKIPGELIKLSSDRFSQAYDTENLYVDGLLNDNIAGESLYFEAINWLYHTHANYSLVKTIMHVTSVRQAEAISFFEADVDYIFNSPKSVDIQGVSIDVDRDTASAFSISGDSSNLKDFMILRGYSGSVMEHLGFDIPIGTTTAVSGIKAIQIANTQGIPIHKIDSTNIDSILPQLQVSSNVITDIQNAVNAGLEVTIPERNIQYYDWEGVGYIIMDTDTGAAAYRISGGTDGAVILARLGAIIPAIGEFFGEKALVTEGESRWYPWGTVIGIITGGVYTLLEFAYVDFQTDMALGSLYVMGYCPIFKRTYNYHEFIDEIAKPKYKILYHAGHGDGGGLILNNDLLFIQDSTGTPLGFVEGYQVNEVPTSHYNFVFLDSCESNQDILREFASSCSLGYDIKVGGGLGMLFDMVFWLTCLKGLTINEANTKAEGFTKKFSLMWDFHTTLNGNKDIKLRRW